jgi:hypothetical protein
LTVKAPENRGTKEGSIAHVPCRCRRGPSRLRPTARSNVRAGRAVEPSDDVPEWLDDFFDDVATFADEAPTEAADDALFNLYSTVPFRGGAAHTSVG